MPRSPINCRLIPLTEPNFALFMSSNVQLRCRKSPRNRSITRSSTPRQHKFPPHFPKSAGCNEYYHINADEFIHVKLCLVFAVMYFPLCGLCPPGRSQSTFDPYRGGDGGGCCRPFESQQRLPRSLPKKAGTHTRTPHTTEYTSFIRAPRPTTITSATFPYPLAGRQQPKAASDYIMPESLCINNLCAYFIFILCLIYEFN